MNKKDVLKILDISSLVSIVLATLLVVIFEFTGQSLLVKYAIVLYLTSFLIAIVYFSLQLVFTSKKYNLTESSDLETQKIKKVGFIVKLILLSLASVFTLIVLILY